MMIRSSSLRCLLSLFCVFIAVSGCDRSHQNESTTVIAVWAHAGQQSERNVLNSQVERFNAEQPNIKVKLTYIPERDYNAQIQAATLAGDLPDLLEFDGPYLYNYIWQKQIVSLEELLPPTLISDLLPSIVEQGTFQNKLYSVGAFDSGLGLYARKSVLQKVGARIPTSYKDAWTIQEFNQLLKTIAAQDEGRAVLDLKLNYAGEWYTYGFSPILQSAGAGLINRENYQSSRGTLNSDAAVSAMQQLQNWIKQGLVDTNLDDAAFTTGRVALSWVGHWEYTRYKNTFGEDLLVLPLPDFGQGSRTGQGSWNWGISRHSDKQKQAATFLNFIMQTDEILAMSNANSAVPGRKSAVQKSSLFGNNGALRLFAEQLIQGVAISRPKTPAYPVITTEFQHVFQQIRNGVDVKQVLDNAAQKIDQDIRDNKGYPFIE